MTDVPVLRYSIAEALYEATRPALPNPLRLSLAPDDMFAEPWLARADAALTVLRHTLQQHPEQIEELGWICVARTPVRRPVFAPPAAEEVPE